MKTRYNIFYFMIILVLSAASLLSANGGILFDSRGNQLPEILLGRISVNFTDILLLEALAEIEQKGKFYFNFNQNIIPEEKRVSAHFDEAAAVVVLKKVLDGTDIDFVVTHGGQIVLIKSRTVYREKFTLSGFVTDAETGEVLIGTNIYNKKLKAAGTSNKYGFYSITLPKRFYEMNFGYVGYETQKIDINLTKNQKLNVELAPSAMFIDTITINARLEYDLIKSTEMGTEFLDPKEFKTIPVFFGEQDVLKTIQLLPGISQTRDGDSGFFVRGGNSDQNLVLLDEAPIYNAFHLMGFFSVFNSDAINSVKLIKGPAPPKYGGRLSSVLDIHMREGNSKKYTGNGGLGLIFSRFTLEGPLINNKSSFIISGRRTYADLFNFLSSNKDVKKSRLYFYDFNLKANYRIGPYDRIFLSGYFGRDVFNFKKEIFTYGGNRTTTFRWNHLFSDKLFFNSSVVFSNLKYDVKVHEEESEYDEDEVQERVRVTNIVNDISFKENFQYFYDTRNTVNFGFEYIYHNFLPGETSVRGDENYDITIGRRKAHETALYASHEFTMSSKLKFDYGLRYSRFSVRGLADDYDAEDIDDIFEIDLHKKERKVYKGYEPRITLNYSINDSSSIKMGYARNYQHLHLLSNATSGTPRDVWQPSSNRIKPQIADQVSLGYFQNFKRKKYELSAETFYKDLQNQTAYKDGADVFLSNFFESDIVFGFGWAYGIELMIKKKYGRLTGWAGYTFSRSQRKFDEINNGRSFPIRYDRTHDISLVCNYKINRDWVFSANWIYYTGNAVTVPYGKYTIDNRNVLVYTRRNGYRMPAYHRLDLGFTYTTRKGHYWNFFLYNAYGRRNPYSIHFRETENNIETVRVSLFSFVPGITYNFKF